VGLRTSEDVRDWPGSRGIFECPEPHPSDSRVSVATAIERRTASRAECSICARRAAEFAHQLLAGGYSETICGYRGVGVECRAGGAPAKRAVTSDYRTQRRIDFDHHALAQAFAFEHIFSHTSHHEVTVRE